MKLRTLFRPDYERYEGVRPIQVQLARLGYVLVFVFVGQTSWGRILSHQGAWDPVQAAALSMWAAQALLSVLGILYPLKMLPLILFEVVYKLLWLGIVALPLWWSRRLAGSSAEEMTYAFLPVIIPIVLVPWAYVFRKYVWSRTGTSGFARS